MFDLTKENLKFAEEAAKRLTKEKFKLRFHLGDEPIEMGVILSSKRDGETKNTLISFDEHQINGIKYFITR